MTQSGQGEQPSARPAREGIVLPSDGGEPLLPGMTGDRAVPAVPAGGQTWDQPWGPDPSAAPAPQPAEGWGAPVNGTQTWGGSEQSPAGAPAPDWGGHNPSTQTWAAPEQPAQGWGAAPAQQQGFQAQQAPGAGALPAEGAQPPSYGEQRPYGDHQPPSYGGQETSSYGGQQDAGYGGHQGGAVPPHQPQGAAALPPAVPGALPPAVDEGATQYIPPVPAATEGATQFLPPVAAAPDEGATQYIPPVGPGALPPEVSSGPLPQAAHPDAEATQYIAPVPAEPGAPGYGIRPGGPEDRQPPAEFDNLFRSAPGGPSASEGPSSTQQLPRFEAPAGHAPHTPHAPYAAQAPGMPGAPGGRAATRRGAADDGNGGRGGRSGSRVPLIAAVGIGIVVLGVGAGALLGGGGSDSGKDDSSKNVSATAGATDGSSSSAADPAKAQAVALDKLLADSNNSRDSVIKAVENVKACNNLDQAASDLRDAAKQRSELVTRLSGLSVDKLPNNAQLTAALNSAWQASASADNHYAAWADQVKGKKGCRKGQARSTGQRAAGDQASGTATAQKVKAAKLWNSIASTYGLTRRTTTQL
ncbi:hypothetical protein OG840_47765 [Streptomyces sp. NBC_01764]|uniref:hypothetical protein n=1 Tax=Streptomyces sp. NBC_01764 TaxID=2975935 RepID=UPI0022513129|nr:hypothetical protein [Streptomyces sp. NBC_01764]MCX4409091.1 hypothetical protein [Streptomyces sp. NBC_01764]